MRLCQRQQCFFLFRVPLRLVDQPEIHLGAGHDAALLRSAAEGVRLLLCQLPDPFPCQCRRIKAQARLLPHGRIWSFKIGIQRAVQKRQTASLEKFSHKKQGILPIKQCRIKTDIPQQLPVGQHPPAVPAAPFPHPRVVFRRDPLRCRAFRHCPQGLVFPYAAVAAHSHASAATAQGIVQPFQILRQHKVIGIHKADVFAPCHIQPKIARRGHPTVFFVENAHPGILRRIALHDLPAVVRRTIVHNDQLKIPVGLRQQAVQTRGQILFHLIDRYDHRDQGAFFCIHPALLFKISLTRRFSSAYSALRR